MLLHAVHLADEQDAVALGGKGQVAGTAKGLQYADLLGIDGVGAGVADLAENRYLEVLEAYIDYRVPHVLAYLIGKVAHQFVSGHAFHVNGAEDGELDVAFGIHQIGKGGLLGIGAVAAGGSEFGKGEVIWRSDGFVGAADHDCEAVVFLYGGLVLVEQGLQLTVAYVLEIDYVLIARAGGEKRRHEGENNSFAKMFHLAKIIINMKLSEAAGNYLPVEDIPEGCKVVRATVLVIQIVGVLPHVES